ncbi:MAG TPA: protein-glutamate O-methyltransferase CheR [Verrucomicrobiae bacterium]|jgi:chemotaxis protein methyltransferase CheR|nr:protein-glutamate O-methyltransferase CheR [Verrucomicrobiae bacterium]
MPAISKIDFDYISQLAFSQAALVFESGKEYLIETRLTSVAEREGFASLADYVARLRAETKINGIHFRAIDALTTNETLFFRDFHPFDALRRHILPEIIAQRAHLRRLSIWSAACSSGQEPYTIAMILREHFPELANWNVTILATDLSPTILKAAQEGRYTQFEVNRGLPASYLVKHFTNQDGKWAVKDDLKKMIEFRPMNLNQSWPVLPPLDLVFIRNVMIYFDIETKKTILKKIRHCLLPHGFLFLGTAETTINLDAGYQPVTYGKAVVYRGLRGPAA